MKKKRLFIIVGIILFILVVGIVALFKSFSVGGDGDYSEQMEIVVQKVKKESLDETILVTGKIVPEDEQKIYASSENGEIKTFKVEENSKVKAGDPLFIYDQSQIDSEFNKAVRARDMLNNNVKAVEQQINQLAKQIETLKKLDEDVSELEIEKSQLALELENVKAEVSDAQATINDIQKEKEALTVRSKIDGTVVKVNKNVEQTEEGATEPIVHIVSSKPFKVIGTMSEFDTVKIKPEQKVIIRPKVFKDREWKGHVESISQFPTDDGIDEMDMYAGEGNVTMYPFKVAITDDTKDLRQGFHVSLEVSVGDDEKKVVVPHSALLDDMMDGMDDDFMVEDEIVDVDDSSFIEESSYVYVLIDGVLHRRDVEVGSMNDELVEIKEGVEVGELVVITPHFDMYDGMEVTEYDEVD